MRSLNPWRSFCLKSNGWRICDARRNDKCCCEIRPSRPPPSARGAVHWACHRFARARCSLGCIYRCCCCNDGLTSYDARYRHNRRCNRFCPGVDLRTCDAAGSELNPDDMHSKLSAAAPIALELLAQTPLSATDIGARRRNELTPSAGVGRDAAAPAAAPFKVACQ